MKTRNGNGDWARTMIQGLDERIRKHDEVMEEERALKEFLGQLLARINDQQRKADGKLEAALASLARTTEEERRKTEAAFADLARTTEGAHAKTDELQKRTEAAFADLAREMAKLARASVRHARRIRRVEGRGR